MATTINYNGTAIRLSSRFVGEDYPKWSKGFKKVHHKITVKTDRASHTFDFWNNDRNGHRMSAQNLVEAFEMFLSDGISYDNSRDIDDFAAEFGYEKVSDLLDAWNGCKAAFEAWEEFSIDPYDLDNWLREKYDL